MNDDFTRFAAMLSSVDNTMNYPHDRHSKAQVVRAAMGSIRPEDTMLALCACGWRGTMGDCHERVYHSDTKSWRKLAGRSGWHWECPVCAAVVWILQYHQLSSTYITKGLT